MPPQNSARRRPRIGFVAPGSERVAELWLREATEAEAAAAAIEQEDWGLVTCDAAGLPFGMVGELRRKLSPIVLLVLLLFMGVDLKWIFGFR